MTTYTASSWLDSPAPLRLRNLASNHLFGRVASSSSSPFDQAAFLSNPAMDIMKSHDSHPDFAHLILLVFQAVLEVVIVSAPGYVVARMGILDSKGQKMMADLNIRIFTPCLIFSKLAGQLDADRLQDLVIIPLIFIAQTLVSYLCALATSKVFGFEKRPRNFVIAMGVFGNSNSLPISLVFSLSKTLKGLHWDKIPGDNDAEVAARGILYLLIFQQLGQMLRWTWGYSVLLAPPQPPFEAEDSDDEQLSIHEADESDRILEGGRGAKPAKHSPTDSDYGSGPSTGSVSSSSSVSAVDFKVGPPELLATPTNGNISVDSEPRQRSTARTNLFPTYSSLASARQEDIPAGVKGWPIRVKRFAARTARSCNNTLSTFSHNLFRRFPTPVQRVLSFVGRVVRKFALAVWAQLNPPLMSMIISLIVATVPALKRLFFTPGTF
ncbi:hypothetical protein LTR66_015545, partial [Elasticomyces elasticus]